MIIKFKPLYDDVTIPQRATEGSSGFDVCFYDPQREEIKLYPGERALFKTGLSVEIPVGYEIQVRSRSGLALKHGIIVLNSPGTIDADYRGEIGVILYNADDSDGFVIKKGERIAQLVPMQLPTTSIKIAKTLKETQRGTGGFGSTGL